MPPAANAIDAKNCPKCGQLLDSRTGAADVCPRCLLGHAIETLSPDDHAALRTLALTGRAPRIADLNKALPALEFHELLGTGGAGWVYLATQRTLKRPVAVKLLRRKLGDFGAADKRFQQEARTLAAISHPRLVTVHDYGALKGHHYLVMEYIAGGTLRDRLQAESLNVRDTVEIGVQVCEALEFAHSQGVIHRDLKPENILFAKEEASDALRLKIADFGIAKMVGPDPATSYTATGTVIGTPYYMAPEQHVAKAEATPAGDLFSLGVMLYEMLTGRLPVGNLTPLTTTPGVPASLQSIILRALAAEPQDRYASAAEMKGELITSLDAERSRPASRANATIVSMALLAATLLGFMYWTMTGAATSAPTIAETQDPDKGNHEPSTLPTDATDETAATASEEPEEVITATAAPTRSGVVIQEARILTQRPFTATLEFDLDFSHYKPVENDESTLHWVYRPPRGDRASGAVPRRGSRKQVTIEAPLPRMIHNYWPGELYVEERWGDATGGKRRVSAVFRIQGWHVDPIPH